MCFVIDHMNGIFEFIVWIWNRLYQLCKYICTQPCFFVWCLVIMPKIQLNGNVNGRCMAYLRTSIQSAPTWWFMKSSLSGKKIGGSLPISTPSGITLSCSVLYETLNSELSMTPFRITSRPSALCEKPLKKWHLDYSTFLCLSLSFLIVNPSILQNTFW